MIIQSLCRYYDVLRDDPDPDVKISEHGYCSTKVSFVFVISADGELENILDIRNDGKKRLSRLMNVPLQKDRPSTKVQPYFLCDKAKYVLGVELLKSAAYHRKYSRSTDGKNCLANVILEENDKEVVFISEASRKSFHSFKEYQHLILDDVKNPAVSSFLAFLDNWIPDKALEIPKIAEYRDVIFSGGSIVFKSGESYLHENRTILDSWERYTSLHNNKDEKVLQCLVSGNIEPVSRLHKNIVGVNGTHGAGAPLVSFNKKAFESYGNEQSYNAPVGTLSMFKYTTALNYLLASERNRISFGDTTVVFWAETLNHSCEELAASFITPPKVSENNIENDDEGESWIRDRKKIREIMDILSKVRKGQHLNNDDLGTDPDTNFYILGLAPNKGRISVRFWYINTFGEFIEKIAQNYLDMEIVRDDSGPQFVSPIRLLLETIPKRAGQKELLKEDWKKIPPIFEGLLMRSILNGAVYPVQMYNAILSRAKVERSINYARAGFIKAYLLRQSRSGSSTLKEELISVKLNEENPDVPYRLGRLFAVLEKVQSETNKNMGSTITSKYFSSASTTPAVVYPVLLKLAQHHIAKSDWGFRTNQSIEEILSGVDTFPEYLTLEEQGMFMLGYYHQRKANYSKKSEKAVEEE